MMVRKWLTGLTVAALVHLLSAGMPAASAAEPAPLAQGGVTVTKSSGRNWVVEALVVVALSGAALYAICKSSRRV